MSADKQTVLMHYTLAGTYQEATENVEGLIHVVEEANAAGDFLVLIGGDASVAYENNELSAEDLEKGERIGDPGRADHLCWRCSGPWSRRCCHWGLAIVAIVLALAAVGVIGQAFELTFGIFALAGALSILVYVLPMHDPQVVPAAAAVD